MIHFRIRDYLSVIFYRTMISGAFQLFGRGTRVVWPLRIVGSRFVKLGNAVTLQYGAYIAVLKIGNPEPLLTIGSGCQIGNYSHIICTQLIEIGERVLVADRVYIADNSHDYRDVGVAVMDQPLRQLAPVSIGAGSWIGENVCIVGCSIGRNCVVGANSVVTRSIPDNCVAFGCPAVPVKRFCPETSSWRKVDSSGSFKD